MKLLSKESLSLLALKAFSLILLLFLLTAPVFCLVIERDMRAGATGIPFGYLAARGVRLALTVGLCLWLRHRSRAVLDNSGNRQVLGFALVLGCAVLCLALSIWACPIPWDSPRTCTCSGQSCTSRCWAGTSCGASCWARGFCSSPFLSGGQPRPPDKKNQGPESGFSGP